MTPEELLINAVKTHQKVDLFEQCGDSIRSTHAPRRCMTLHLPPKPSQIPNGDRPQYVTFTWDPDLVLPVLVVRAPGDARAAIDSKDLWRALEARWYANDADRKRKEAEARALTLAAITEGLQAP